MKKTLYSTLLTFFVLGILSSACKKETISIPPSLSFVIDTGYIYQDTIIASGDTAIIGLTCTWNGSYPISSINKYYNGKMVGNPILVEPAFGQQFTLNTKIMKSHYTIDKWGFDVSDSKGNTSSVTLVLRIDSGGPIKSVNARIGAQLHPFYGPYFDFTNGKFYDTTQVKTNQGLVDMVAGFDFDYKYFFASPSSSSFFGVYDLSSWSTRNSTKFCLTNLSLEQYTLINCDKLLISSFHEDKAKDLISEFKTNNIISFRTNNGTYGLIKIINVSEGEMGWCTFDYLIQDQ